MPRLLSVVRFGIRIWGHRPRQGTTMGADEISPAAAAAPQRHDSIPGGQKSSLLTLPRFARFIIIFVGRNCCAIVAICVWIVYDVEYKTLPRFQPFVGLHELTYLIVDRGCITSLRRSPWWNIPSRIWRCHHTCAAPSVVDERRCCLLHTTNFVL